ncbi:hypothetical protein AXF42_Ash021295 [Apostasia shenzhenica]|uniref:Uncharacterized protein n=1 Tax=Apostasia shenzhenica TaxID=1088818 RepID=A0A2H9ZYN0_9ASPA|nr:hypothetical protein AXF42_Ash021295 [Apostasia shenzhenica]
MGSVSAGLLRSTALARHDVSCLLRRTRKVLAPASPMRHIEAAPILPSRSHDPALGRQPPLHLPLL